MKSTNRSLNYVDLFAGDGICECAEAPKPKWKPPYFRNMDESNLNNLDLKCIFNDMNKMNILSERLKPYEKNIIGLYNEDANKIYKTALRKIPPEKWSIFNLDPQIHSDLSFSTIESISYHETWDNISRCVRKPELIITFMTYSMQQYLKTIGRDNVRENKKKELLKTIDKSLGTDSWRDKILGLTKEMREDKTHNIFLNIFLDQLGKLGYDTVYFQIHQTAWKSIVYFLIFATAIPRAYNILSERFEPYINDIKKDKWVKENFIFYKMAKAKEQGIKILDDFI
jgi:three-Cys-motif partner protein